MIAALLLGASACAGEDSASTAEARAGDTRPPADFDLLLSPVVIAPLGGLAEIDVTVRSKGSFFAAVDLTVDTTTPGVVGVPGAVGRGGELGSVRIGATAPLTLGATFSLRVTGRSGGIAHTVTASATVVDKAGTLDPSFGGAGTFVVRRSKYSFDGFDGVRAEPEGGILAAGTGYSMVGSTFRAAHVRADGSGDPAWGSGWGGVEGALGIVLPDKPRSAEAHAICRQSTGRVVVAGMEHRGQGRTADHIAVAGLSLDGALDWDFGTQGATILAPDGDSAALAMALAPDDGLLVAGYAGRRALVVRLTPDGAPDPTFADGGYARLDPGEGAASQVRGVAIDGAGRILAVGDTGTSAFLARLSADGTVETSFRFGETLPTPEPADAVSAQAVALQPDGAVLVGGTVRRSGTTSVAVWRFLPDGEPDVFAFGLRGLVVLPVSGSDQPMAGLTLLPDGRIVIAADADAGAADSDSPHAKPLLIRLLSNGTRDPTFGAHGVVRVPLGDGDVVLSIDHTGDGKLALGLRLRTDEMRGGQFAALARVWE